MKNKKIYIFLILHLVIQNSFSQIEGQLKLDSSWHPVAYLSHIPYLDKMNHMSHEIIIAETPVTPSGFFKFKTSYLTQKEKLYRIHIAKKGYSAASLIIGSDDENHFFVLAKKNSKVMISDSTYVPFLSDVEMHGYQPNLQFQQIRQWVKYADTLSYETHGIKREFLKKALSEKLLEAADTSQHPLVALYALSESNFQQHSLLNPGFYQQFFNKWSDYSSSIYFVNFKQKLSISDKNSQWWLIILTALTGILAGMLFYHLYLNLYKKTNDPHQELTIQERKILASLQDGKSNKELSQEFNIELSTVKSHINSIYSKLNIKSRKEIYKSNS